MARSPVAAWREGVPELVDRERALGWTVAQTVAWSRGAPEPHLDTVRWLLEAA